MQVSIKNVNLLAYDWKICASEDLLNNSQKHSKDINIQILECWLGQLNFYIFWI